MSNVGKSNTEVRTTFKEKLLGNQQEKRTGFIFEIEEEGMIIEKDDSTPA